MKYLKLFESESESLWREISNDTINSRWENNSDISRDIVYLKKSYEKIIRNYLGKFDLGIIHRKVKLSNRGWEEVTGFSDIRDVKINDILENNLEYIREY
jgi:hypothetical protein